MLYLLIAAIFVIICLCLIIYRQGAAAAKKNAAFERLKQAYNDLEETKPVRDLGHSAAVIAHKIKNQISVISGYATLLNKSKTIDYKDLRMADNILQASMQINESSISVLDAVRAGVRGKTEPFDAVEILNSCVETCFKKQKALFTLNYQSAEKSVFVNGDGLKLQRALINVFRNSIEANAQKIAVNVRTFNTAVLITIDDDGTGCVPEQFPNLFIPFYTSKKSKPTEANGIGLSVTRSAAEALGGRVSIYCKNLLGDKNSGFSVQIMLPLTRQSAIVPAKSDLFLIKKDFMETNRVLNILTGMKIIPHIADTYENIEPHLPNSRSGVVLASPSLVNELGTGSDGNALLKILAVEESANGSLLVKASDRNKRELFTEDFIISYLYNDEPCSVN